MELGLVDGTTTARPNVCTFSIDHHGVVAFCAFFGSLATESCAWCADLLNHSRCGGQSLERELRSFWLEVDADHYPTISYADDEHVPYVYDPVRPHQESPRILIDDVVDDIRFDRIVVGGEASVVMTVENPIVPSCGVDATPEILRTTGFP